MIEADLVRFLDRKLYEIGSAMMAYYDCCGFNGDACKARDPSPCCVNTIFGKGLCPHSSNRKCTFDNCDCKLWLCQTAINTTDPKCVEGLLLLEKFGKLYGIVRDPLIGHPYSGADKQPK